MPSKRVPLTDALFLYGETRESMIHVAGLTIFSPPPDAGPDFIRQLHDSIRQSVTVQPPWNRRLATPNFLRNPVHRWIEDDELDIDYHLRRSALPSPGSERELGILVSRLHSHPIDFSRPPWECHIIEGLEGGRFALYTKIHHSLVDGYTGSKMLARALSHDPDDRDTTIFFGQSQPPRHKNKAADADGLEFGNLFRNMMGQWGSARSIGKAALNLRRSRRGEIKNLVASLQAPQSILNSKVSRNRRFATQQYSLTRLKELGHSMGATLNDVVLALCGGGLRKFLLEMDELPTKPLVAFLPVNVRPKDDPGGGNQVGAMLASLGTDIADPLERLQAICDSTRQGKAQMKGMSAGAIVAYSGLLLAPFNLQAAGAAVGLKNRVPLTLNLCISNVPGPTEPLYFRGARLEASYPVSIPTHGAALNITCQSYADTLNFGFIGCRDSLPHLQNLAVYTGEALEELEQAIQGSRTA